MAKGGTKAVRRRSGSFTPLAPGQSVFNPRAYQRIAIADPSRFKAYMWSRQTGKGFSVAMEINNDILETEARGDATDWMIVSRSLIAARQLGRKVAGIGRAMTQAMQAVQPTLEKLSESQFELVYPGGSRVLILSSSPDAAVGFTGNVCIDEIDTHKQANDLFGNTFPVVSTGQHRLIVTSTPRGRRIMHRLWTDSKKPDTRWSFHRLTIHEAIEQGCDQDAELLRRALNDELKWRQEYLCEFVDDEICWIPWELITGCTSDLATVDPQAALKSIGDDEIVAGWDVARWNHLSALALIAKRGRSMRMAGLLVMRRMPFHQQLDNVGRTLRMFPRVRRLIIDATNNESLSEQAASVFPFTVEGVKFTGAYKETIATDVRRTMEEQALLLPDDERVQSDFHSLRRTQTSAGNYRFEGEADGSHADIFWAAAMAVNGAISGGTPELFLV